MNYLDFIIAVPLAFGAWKGYQKGLIFEVSMIIGLILGFYLAFKFSGIIQHLVSGVVSDSILPYFSFFLVFTAVVVVMILLAKFLEQIIKAGSLTPVNQLLGGLLGLLKWGLVLSVVISLMRPIDAQMNLLNAKVKSESVLYAPVSKLGSYLFPALEDIQKEFKEQLH